MNLDGDFTRKKLSKFLCQELLYEFVTHNLEASREKEVTDYLATCRDSQRELDNLNKGLRFTQAAAQLKISPKLFEALENFEPHWKKTVRAWTITGSQRGWKMLPYIILVLAVMMGVFITKPWVKGVREDVLLAEQMKQEPDMYPAPAAPVAQVSVAAAPSAATPAINEEAASPPVPQAVPSATYMPDMVETLVKDLLPMAKTFRPSNFFVSKAAEAGRRAEILRAENARKEELETKTPAASDSEEAIGRGFLYRSEVQVQDFQNSWPAIRDKIVALGGKVAGNVELGWLRKPTESYFHFTLPESNRNEFEIFLGTFSPVQFTKDRHPRVMPDGQIRIIMTVKDGMTHNESPSETP